MDNLLPELIALGQVILIDLVLAGDNAIVVGMAAAGVAARERSKVILWGIVAAVVLRIGFAMVTTQLLAIVGLTLAGGLLLLWVCWKLFRETREHSHQQAAAQLVAAGTAGTAPDAVKAPKSVRSAIWQVALADVSMSLDNVLAVAGAARDHLWVLVVGLVLSVALMGVAANFVARVLQRHHWIAYVGLVVIVYVALKMIWDGSGEVLEVL